MRRFVLPALILISTSLSAATYQRGGPIVLPHYVLEATHSLSQTELDGLLSEGVEIEETISIGRYLVRSADATRASRDPRIRSLQAYDGAHKITGAAYREVAHGKAFAKLRVMFHREVTFDQARAAIEEVGGTIETPLSVAVVSPQRLVVRIPSGALDDLAADERVFGIYGPPLRPVSLNDQAAALSRVTPLYASPYNLTGDGVSLSLFELAGADTTHKEFAGRLTVHFGGGSAADGQHATHVAGTMIAAGISAKAKGMSPTATAHEFNVTGDSAGWLNDKENSLPPLGVVADNNSWGFLIGWRGFVWEGNAELLGQYDGFFSATYDKIARGAGEALFVHSAGNEATAGNPELGQFSAHEHVDDITGDPITDEIFCYSQNGSGTDCPAPACTPGPSTKSTDDVGLPVPHCETVKHPTYGPFTTVGLMASTKNSLTVGAVSSDGNIASFSSRGPARDGRIKPELVAYGLDQYSTLPGNLYGYMSGTSMSAPVVTGIAGVVTQQYRLTFGKTPTAAILKTLLIAGADDLVGPDKTLDLPGPDYTYGFGLVDAKNTVDLIRADGGTGLLIRTGSLADGQDVTIPMTIAATANARVVLGWFDPEVLPLPGEDFPEKTLLNDLDLKVIAPNGDPVLPYVLDGAHPSVAATRGVNNTDTTEMIDLKNAAPGTYLVKLHGRIGDPSKGTTQDYVLAMIGFHSMPRRHSAKH